MDNAQLLFKQIVDGGYNGIKNMIGTTEENLFLDFKRKANPLVDGLKREDKTTYAKALSGFSNASGGVIVWGIDARKEGNTGPDVASEEKPIAGLKRFLTDLNSLISDALDPVNTGVINREIYLNDDSECDKGFIVSYVPASDLPPHRAMCTENIYYTRAGDNFIMMEHFMLEDAFGKRRKPHLEIFTKLVRHPISIMNNNQKFHVLIGIKNVGKYMANYPSLRVKVLNGCNYSKEDRFNSYTVINLKRVIQTNQKTEETGLFFTGGNDDCIHPNTYLEITRLDPVPRWTERESLIKLGMNNERLIFEYSLFAEGFSEKIGTVKFTPDQIRELLEI
ncbi:ATP-binding protein [Paenibacillus sp. RRE4]|uniref:AlbA family DNA-binding domain-containing protein n=1 Tax=Paenibacillus sp. RRE4 TaxID=2962587 RepID=UPI002881B09D|nr:ATP-binding protein [Paenibacillus sp. RRE4]MDT0123888.1 ATP-binding protein [Paenibacillus sp. RRE4]